MRIFIGINFDKDTMDGIAGVQTALRGKAVRGRFKYIGNFHLTLKFLGEADQKKAEDVGLAIQDCAARNKSFQLKIDKLGCFEGRGRNQDAYHAVWLGFSGELALLNKLFADIEEEMHKLGFKKEARGYTPHATIAQDIIFSIPFDELKKQISLEGFKPIHIKEIHLIKSEEVNGKRIYTPIYTATLK